MRTIEILCKSCGEYFLVRESEHNNCSNCLSNVSIDFQGLEGAYVSCTSCEYENTNDIID